MEKKRQRKETGKERKRDGKKKGGSKDVGSSRD